MEITPSVFEETDQYHEELNRMVCRLQSSRYYGLLPGSSLKTQITLEPDTINIKVEGLLAVAKNGVVMTVLEDTFPIPKSDANGTECYIAVCQDGVSSQEMNSIDYVRPRYIYMACSLQELDSDERCVPIAKLTRDAAGWKVCPHYIPACVAVKGCQELTDMLNASKLQVQNIAKSIKEKYPKQELLTLRLLFVELEGYTGIESPAEYYLLMKKIVTVLSSLHLSETRIPEQIKFLPFNNNDIYACFERIHVYLTHYKEALSVVIEQPQPEEEDIEVWDADL